MEMVEVCERCKILEKYKYWHEFPASKHQFFKIMLGDFENQLRIPPKFVDYYKGKLCDLCMLKGPSGNKWKVRVENTTDALVFSSGWRDFVREHRLKISDFLVFRYDGCSSFEVSIFDPTGCEREASYFAKKQRLNSQAVCGSSLHENSNFGSQCVFEETAHSKEEFGSDEQDSSANRRKGKKNAMSERKDKRKAPSLEEQDMFGDEKGEQEEEDDWSKEANEDSGHRFRLPRRGETSRAKQTQKYYISNRRSPTTQEKQRALLMAINHKKRCEAAGLPVVVITMLCTHVYKGFHLTIPNEWALEHMLREDHEVKLQVAGSKGIWTVGCKWTPQQCQIRAKWPWFVLDNNLEKHDVCVFELVQKGDLERETNPVIKVHIFRVVAEIVPLTVSKN